MTPTVQAQEQPLLGSWQRPRYEGAVVSRADLLALTPASVAALANLGLVKRAQREIAAGEGPELAEDDAGVVTGRFKDGVVTTLVPGADSRTGRST